VHAVLAEYSSTVSPGIAGFLVTFGLALATWLLIRSMVGRIRRLRYTPDPAARPDQEVPDQEQPDQQQPAQKKAAQKKAPQKKAAQKKAAQKKAAQQP
jgi:hypothetical protein